MGIRKSSMGRRRFLALSGAGATAALLVGGGIARASLSDGGSGPKRPKAARPLYLGTFTSGEGAGTGIGLATYDPQTGEITSTGVLEGVADPSFLALSPSGRHLYAVNEREQGTVTALAVAEDGGLTVLNSRSTGGGSPTHLSVHPKGRHLLSANFGSGSVAVHPIGEDGSLGELTDLVQHTGSGPDPSQTGPRAHMVVTDPGGAFVLAVDLGTDSVETYRLDEKAGTLRSVSRAAMKPGAGPRHLAFHPSGQFLYVANELDNTVVVCRYDAETGTVTPGEPQPTVPDPDAGGERNFPGEVLVSPDGRFVYLSNRGHNSIAVFAVQAKGARLKLLQAPSSGGDFPRHISLDPSGSLLFAANQKSGSVVSFIVNAETGDLKATGSPLTTPIPVCALPV